MMGFGMLFSLAVLIGIVILIVWGVNGFSGGGIKWNQPSANQSPKEILQARYARGEITREQVNRILIESMPHMEGWSYENEGAGGAGTGAR